MTLTVDGIPFTRHAGAWTWPRPTPVPAAWTDLLDALYFGAYDTDAAGHLRLATTGARVFVRFRDSHDAAGQAVPGGRDSGLMFPAKALGGRVTRAQTGTLDGAPVVCVELLGDPLAT